jgi:threonine dehydrogenase-like Zn-dependent dehydrogenase
VLHAAAELGGGPESELGAGVHGLHVVVTGAGVVGLLTALFAVAHGAAEVAVVDASPRRLKAARALGLLALDETDAEPWLVLKDRWVHGARDRGADVALQCRGRASALAGALRCLRPQGTAIDLAFYQDGAPELRLGEEFHHNGLTIRCAQIARVPRGFERTWGRPRLRRETLALLEARGAEIRGHLVTDVVALDDGPELMLALAERRRDPIQAVFSF